ncbi:uncharacterized protein M421DRAFT_414878 [Didymella exigua CBS 183.55]|uniref:Mitochondrial import receptor subunit n=1 Tax=Didymella exigua CBS 183.55 TaxID=1150837 RepID=A0A6A5S1Q6_9PLEO|nr:uncharacterized protein M421DRAFT_414878 [Didymella exigua CBS 183.55]KAF1933823.1 hypothetical protein M421DRAFT_414878 [Didymella exigua CBS 183.55]
MALELHVWGPAFGLPSIDPECIATVTYCQQVIPQEQWSLVASYDRSVGLTESLPILFDGGIATATGYEDIVSYLRNHPAVSNDLDANLSTQQQNDRTAYSTLLRSTATPLIDLSLFVSAENYNTITSSAYTAILPWYANYTVPPKRRKLARTRTAHMGLDSLDVDTRTEEVSGPGRGTASAEFEAAKRAAGLPTESKPSTMSIGRGKGFGGLLGTQTYAAKFRLDAVSNDMLAPLSDLLGNHEYLLGTSQPSSLDCLAFGYLALMLFPAVPQAWLKETISTKFPRLAAYVQMLRKDVLTERDISSAQVWAITTGRASSATEQSQCTLLPWATRSQSFTSSTVTGVQEIIGSIPVVSSLMKRELSVKPAPSSSRIRSELPSPVFVNTLLGLTAAVAVGFASFAFQHRRSPREGELIFWALRPSVGLGDAGNIFNVLGQLPSGSFSQF